MKRTIERVIASVPLNRTAASVVNEREGEHWEPELPPGFPHFKAPPPMQPVPPAAKPLVGERFDRLVVVGYYGRHPKKGSQWVCRCTCGDYELRRTKTLVEHSGPDPQMCARCDALLRIRYRYENLPPRDFTKPLTKEVVSMKKK